MKNKILIFIFVLFSYCTTSLGEQFRFDVSKIDVSNNGNLISAYDGKVISHNENLEIIAKNFEYNKKLDFLKASRGIAFIKSSNLKIEFNQLEADEKNLTLAAKGNIKIYDLNNKLLIQSENIFLDRKNNILNSSTKSTLDDENNNSFQTEKFEYKINENILKIEKAKLKDFNNNNFIVELAYINTISNKLIGKDVEINLNNLSFNKNNEPRMKGKSITYNNGNSEISKGVFTACKKTDKCPPWQLSAEKIIHNKKKKSINYENVWLKIYNVPVVYFPKFFHPDPTVKRQSGFLMPTFKNSPNNNTFLSMPYYKVLSENKDLTFTPRFYAKDKLLLQSEYREVNKDNNIKSDVSILNDSNDFKSHFYYKFFKNFNFKNFENNTVDINIQQTSNDTYLKANKLVSPLINSYDILENSIGIKMNSENTSIDADLIVYENLNKISSDRYEYIYPKIDFTKKIKNQTNLVGNFLFKSNNYMQNYETNIFEKVNINDLIFNSDPKITKKGFYNNYEFLLKNSNSSSENSSNFKNGEDLYFSGLFQFNSSLPLIKKNNNFQRLLKPKIALKISPDNTKDISKNTNRLDVNNIYNLNRLSSSETVEGGISLTYGSDYTVTKTKSNQDIFSIKIANNLRLEENKDLERNNQLGAKTSNILTEIAYSPNKYLTTKYNSSIRNNLYDVNYENIIAEISINNFVTTFDYLNENDSDQSSYLLNKTTYNFNDSNNISFSTRENKKTNLTEYYNLMYQYKNDCLAATIEYNKEYYSDRDIKPEESIFLKLTIVPFGTTSTPNLNN